MRKKSLAVQYINEVKLLLPSVHEPEQDYLDKMKYVVDDFCEEKQISNIDDIYREFGSPQETVAEYLSTLEPKQLVGILRMKRIKRWLILSSILCLVILVLLLSVLQYQSRQYIQNEMPLYRTAQLSSTQTITGTKTYYYRDDDQNILWTLSVTATFSYNGISAKCIDYSHSVSSNHRSWECKEVSSQADNNSATATVIMTRHRFYPLSYFDFTESVTIHCSPTGEIS